MSDPYQDHPNVSPGIDSVWGSAGGQTLWIPQTTLNGGSQTAPRTIVKPAAVGTTFISRFDAGHGWGNTPGSGTVADDTSTPGPFATQSIAVTPAASGTAPLIEKTSLTVDISAAPLVVWVKWNDTWTTAPSVFIYAGDSTLANFFFWDRYQAQPSTVNVDGWTAYTLFTADATQTGTPSASSIARIRLRVNNGSGETWLGGVGIRVLPTGVYPNGVITIGFDDSLASVYTLARPLLAKYGFQAVSYTIADEVGAAAAGSWGAGVTLAQLHEMQEYDGWEIAGHAFTKAGHDARYDTLTDAQLLVEFQGLKSWMAQNGFVSDAWASPGGKSNAHIWSIARQFFNTHRSVGGPGGDITRLGYLQTPKPVYAPHLWAATFDTSAMTVANIQSVITKVAANGSWAHLTFHNVISSASTGEAISQTDLDTILSSIQSAGCAVRTVKDVLALV